MARRRTTERRALLWIVACAALVAAGPSVAARGAGAGLEPCRRTDLPADALCGTVEVPEVRVDGARRLDLQVVVLPATGEDRRADPLVVLEGGPGASVLRVAPMYVMTFASARRSRDLVLLDQRGTGSSGALACESLRLAPGAALSVERVHECAARLSETAELTAYRTEPAVADLEAVREQLGYERLNLFGVSYGTRTALEYVRRHGPRVRTATLLGTYPPGENVPLEAGPIAQRSLDLLFEQCGRDRGCSAAYPDPAADLAATLARFGADGLWREPGSEEGIPPTRAALTSVLRLMLFFPTTAAGVPRLLHHAAAGDLGPYRAAAEALAGTTGSWISTGAFLSTLCAEDVARLDPAEVARRAEGTFLGTGWADELRAACAAWPSGAPSEGFYRPLETEIPMLLLVGDLDPSMPPEWSLELAEALPGARAVVLPEGHHSLIGMSRVDCALALIDGFLDAGSAAELDASCVAEMKRPAFGLP